jgi:hypothetical protein
VTLHRAGSCTTGHYMATDFTDATDFQRRHRLPDKYIFYVFESVFMSRNQCNPWNPWPLKRPRYSCSLEPSISSLTNICSSSTLQIRTYVRKRLVSIARHISGLRSTFGDNASPIPVIIDPRSPCAVRICTAVPPLAQNLLHERRARERYSRHTALRNPSPPYHPKITSGSERW